MTREPTMEELSLLADLRKAMGDHGLRMQPELVEYAAELKRKADALDRIEGAAVAASESVAEAKALCAKLSDLQRESLVLSCKGLCVSDIAKMQGINPWTIADRTRRVREKLGVGSMIEAAVLATKAGLA